VPQYRGYKIELMHDGSGWQVTVHPMRPDPPILRQFSFRPEPFPEGAALENVESIVCLHVKKERSEWPSRTQIRTCRSGASSFALRSQVPSSRRFASPMFRRGNFHATRMVERVKSKFAVREIMAE